MFLQDSSGLDKQKVPISGPNARPLATLNFNKSLKAFSRHRSPSLNSRNVSAVFTIIFLRIWHGAWHEVSAYYIFVEYLLHLHRMLIGSKGDKTPYKRVIKEFCAPTKNPKLISMY